jgi:predicted permease
VDWKKVGWTLAAAFLPALLFALIAALLLANDYEIGGLFGLLAGVSLVVWLVFVIDALRRAGRMAGA